MWDDSTGQPVQAIQQQQVSLTPLQAAQQDPGVDLNLKATAAISLTAGATLGTIGWLTGGARRGIGLILGTALAATAVVAGPELVKRPNQAWVLIKHPQHWWLAQDGLRIRREGYEAEQRAFGSVKADRTVADAYRHAFTAANFTLHMMEHRGLGDTAAAALALEIGVANEKDGKPDINSPTAQMDLYNNQVGVDIVGNGRNADGSWMTTEQIEAQVMRAAETGRLMRVSDDGSRLTATTEDDVARAQQR